MACAILEREHRGERRGTEVTVAPTRRPHLSTAAPQRHEVVRGNSASPRNVPTAVGAVTTPLGLAKRRIVASAPHGYCAAMGGVNKATAERMQALPFAHAAGPSQPRGAASHKAERMLASRGLTAFEVLQEMSLEDLDETVQVLKRYKPAGEVRNALVAYLALAPLSEFDALRVILRKHCAQP